VRLGVIDGAASRDLRRRVLRPNLGPDDPLPGDDLASGVHIGAVDDDGAVVGTCFIYPDPCYWRTDGTDAWHLRQMATAPERQHQGIGSAVVGAAVEYLSRIGVALVWCHAREEAVGFYARHGFIGFGDIFLDEHHPVPHLRMSRELSAPATSSG
jgi:GNAT superfamily N-acetyltransferase